MTGVIKGVFINVLNLGLNLLKIALVSGVLPLPPRTRLPMLIIGSGNFCTLESLNLAQTTQ